MNVSGLPLPDGVVEDPMVYYKGRRGVSKVEALSYLLMFTHKNYDCESFSILVTRDVDRIRIERSTPSVRHVLRRWSDLHLDPKYCKQKTMEICRDTDPDYINVEIRYSKFRRDRRNTKTSKKLTSRKKLVNRFQIPAEDLEELLTLVSTNVRSMK